MMCLKEINHNGTRNQHTLQHTTTPHRTTPHHIAHTSHGEWWVLSAPHRTAHIAPRPCPYCIARASHSFMGVGTNNVYAGFYADIALVLVLGCVVCGAALCLCVWCLFCLWCLCLCLCLCLWCRCVAPCVVCSRGVGVVGAFGV